MVTQIEDDTSPADFLVKLKAAGDKAVLVDFFAEWCGPCKMIAPKIVGWSKEFPNVVFMKVDVDKCEEIAASYNIQAMPTFVVFKNGEKVEDLVGANQEKVKELIMKYN